MKIAILGGGFGGVYSTIHLEKLMAGRSDVEITLVSRENFFLMTPLLFEAGSGVLEPRHAVNPIRPLLKRARFVEAEVERVDFAAKVVHARHTPSNTPYELPYDQLVLALGGITNRNLIPGSDTALAFKTLADAIYLRNHVIDRFEQADAEGDPARRQALLTFVVIGGGLVGVELMGELTEFIDNLARSYPRVPRGQVRYHLLEAGPRALAEMDETLAGYAVDKLRQRGVDVRVGTAVASLATGQVELPGGERLAAGTIVLAAGVAPSPLLADFPLRKDRRGRLEVEATLRSPEHPEVWALGDCAAIPDPEGKTYPPLAQHAMREAKLLAANLVAAERGQPLKPFVYNSKGTLAALGHYAGVGKLTPFGGRGISIRGFLAWWVWRTYYVMQMPRFERRLRVIVDWTVALLFKNDIVALSYFRPGER